jgi:DNA-binding SARP family transcriptional activator/TolB-like protein
LRRGACLRAVSDVVLDGKPPADRQLVLHLLGDFAAEIDGREVLFATRKARALAAYLALSETGQDARERLVGLLWSESDEEHARASLRQVVHDIKVACEGAGFGGFRADKQTLSLTRESFSCDVDEVLAAAASGAVHPRLLDTQRIDETLLAGLDSTDPSFNVWVRAKRQLLHDRLTLALERLLSSAGSSADADAAALALLNIDPTHEVACRHLIRTRAARGDVGGAMKVYKNLWDLLEAEYDIEPSKETQDLVVGIKLLPGSSGAAAADAPALSSISSAPGATALPKRLFITVCAFDAGGVSEDKRHVVNGFLHEFVACLARFREWSVRTFTPQQMEQRTWSSPPEYFVEGSAYESGGVVRLIITLRDAVTSICIWSERYNITLDAWYETQQSIVRQIALSLNIHVSAERLRRFASGGDVALEIHDRWLRGQALLLQMASKDWPAAAALVESLLADAPDFSPALSGLVQYRNIAHIALPGQFRDPAKHLETLRIAQRAVQLDPLDSRAQLSLAWTHQLLGRVNEASLHAALAADLNENDAWTLMASGQILAYCGEYERATMLAAASLAITPVPSAPQQAYFMAIKFLCSDYDGCIQASKEGLGMSPAFDIWSCAARAHAGLIEDARAQFEQMLEKVAADWHGQQPATPSSMVRWLLHVFPIAVRADWERLAAGLAAAGAPTDGIEFGVW